MLLNTYVPGVVLQLQLMLCMLFYVIVQGLVELPAVITMKGGKSL